MSSLGSAGNKCLFTVVIASLCDAGRARLLERACASVRAMAEGFEYSISVVANGPRVSQEVLGWLEAQPDVRLIRLRSGSHPLARRVGAELANSEFLGFLDDDDELLPNTLGPKIRFFRQHPEVDVLVTDGLRVDGLNEKRIFPRCDQRSEDFVETMMNTGWGACALTLRTDNVDLSVLDAEFRHMEWTLTALELARRYEVGFLDKPTYRYYQDTPHSLSKRTEHSLAGPELWSRLLRSYAGTRYAPTVHRRYGRACHNASWQHACQGRLREAWRLHIESLRSPGGLAFAPFSAKILMASIRRLMTR